MQLMEMNYSECGLTNWLDMANEIQDAWRHVCGPRVW